MQGSRGDPPLLLCTSAPLRVVHGWWCLLCSPALGSLFLHLTLRAWYSVIPQARRRLPRGTRRAFVFPLSIHPSPFNPTYTRCYETLERQNIRNTRMSEGESRKKNVLPSALRYSTFDIRHSTAHGMAPVRAPWRMGAGGTLPIPASCTPTILCGYSMSSRRDWITMLLYVTFLNSLK